MIKFGIDKAGEVSAGQLKIGPLRPKIYLIFSPGPRSIFFCYVRYLFSLARDRDVGSPSCALFCFRKIAFIIQRVPIF